MLCRKKTISASNGKPNIGFNKKLTWNQVIVVKLLLFMSPPPPQLDILKFAGEHNCKPIISNI